MFAADVASNALGMRLVESDAGTATLAMTVPGTWSTVTESLTEVMSSPLPTPLLRWRATDTGDDGGVGRGDYFRGVNWSGDELIADAVERVRRGRSGVYDVTVRCAGVVVAEFRVTAESCLSVARDRWSMLEHE